MSDMADFFPSSLFLRQEIAGFFTRHFRRPRWWLISIELLDCIFFFAIRRLYAADAGRFATVRPNY